MTININGDYDQITITTDLISDANTSTTISVTYNCTTTYDDIDITGEDGEYNLVPDDLGLTDDFPDGIYYILVTQVDGDSNIVTESQCFLVDQDFSCGMTDTLVALNSDPEQIVKALAFHALKIANDSCTSCSCADWCTLYNTATSTDCEDDAPCGCS